MRNGFTCIGFIIGVAGLAATSMAEGVADPVFSLKAVKLNDVPIAATNLLTTAGPGDLIEADVFISNWAKAAPDGARMYQFRLAGASSAASGGNGTILPVGWLAELDPVVCWPDPDVCRPDEVCMTSKCVDPGHNPTWGVLIDTARPNFIFYGLPILKDISTSILDYLYFADAGESGWADDVGTPKYAGTIKLVVSDHACGTFTWGFKQTIDTVLADRSFQKHFPVLESLEIQRVDH